MRTMTTASCTSISSTRPPCRATMGFPWLSNRSATRSYGASSGVDLPAAAGWDATAGWPPASAARIARPTALPTTGQAAGLRFTTVTRLPDTMTSLTSAPGMAKIACASGEPCASSGEANRRTPPACTGAPPGGRAPPGRGAGPPPPPLPPRGPGGGAALPHRQEVAHHDAPAPAPPREGEDPLRGGGPRPLGGRGEPPHATRVHRLAHQK